MRTLAMLALSLLATPAWAGCLQVPSTYSTLSLALVAATSGDCIEVDGLDPLYVDGTAGSTTLLEIKKSVTIRGLSSPRLPPLRIRGGATVTLEDVVFAESGTLYLDTRAAVWVSWGSLIADGIDMSAVSGHGIVISGEGGAASAELAGVAASDFTAGYPLVVWDGTVGVSDSSFERNSAGAIFLYDAHATLERVQFVANQAEYGADVFAVAGSAVTVSDSTSTGATATASGGSMTAVGSDLTVLRSTLGGCAANVGGAIGIGPVDEATLGEYGGDTSVWIDTPTLTLTEVVVSDCDAVSSTTSDGDESPGYGGAVAAIGSALTWEDVDLQEVSATGGGGGGAWFDDVTASITGGSVDGAGAVTGGAILAIGGDLTVTGTSFLNTGATVDPESAGGAILQIGGILTLDGASFSATTASAYGGAVYMVGDSSGEANLTLLDVSFSGTAAGSAGGAIFAYLTSIDDQRSTFEGPYTWGSESYGGAVFLWDGRMSSTGSTFRDASSVAGGGIATSGSDLTVSGGRFVDGIAPIAAAIGTSGGAILLDGVHFEGNLSSATAPVYVDAPASVEVTNAFFCQNQGYDDGALTIAPSASTVWAKVSRTVFLESSGSKGGAVGWRPSSSGAPALQLEHVDLVGTEGSSALWLASGAARVANAIFHTAQVGVAANGATVDAGRNLWWEVDTIATGTTALPGEDDLTGDPRYDGYVPGSCGSSFFLSDGSPAIDAGEGTDLDGTPADLGAWGAVAGATADGDGDGFPADEDCDDDDAGVNPAAEEVWYDGIDQDCDGNDDDQDGDGYLAAEDCDDTDAERHPGAHDVPNDGIDQDCAGADAQSWVGSAGCSTAGTAVPPAAWVLSLLVSGVGWRRRKEEHPRS